MKRTLALLFSLCLLLTSCVVGSITEEKIDPPTITVDGVTYRPVKEKTNYVRVYFKGFGSVLLTLSPADAPITVENFQSLVAEGFYDGLTIHRVEPGFVIQGGAPKGDGTGGSGRPIKGEFAANGVQNTLSHVRGVISMARTSDPNSATSQFFICLNTETCTYFLDGRYAGFGWVSYGMDVIDAIAGVKIQATAGGTHAPIDKIVIDSMTFMAPDGGSADDGAESGNESSTESGAEGTEESGSASTSEPPVSGADGTDTAAAG